MECRCEAGGHRMRELVVCPVPATKNNPAALGGEFRAGGLFFLPCPGVLFFSLYHEVSILLFARGERGYDEYHSV